MKIDGYLIGFDRMVNGRFLRNYRRTLEFLSLLLSRAHSTDASPAVRDASRFDPLII